MRSDREGPLYTIRTTTRNRGVAAAGALEGTIPAHGAPRKGIDLVAVTCAVQIGTFLLTLILLSRMLDSFLHCGRSILTVLLITAVAGCADDSAPAPPADADGADVAAVTGVGEAADTDVDAAAEAFPADSRQVVLALDGDGLTLIERASGSTRPVGFGQEATVVTGALERVLGGPPAETGRNEDCRLDYATWSGGFSALFADGSFVGWSLREGGPVLTTMAGVGIGSTRAELESAYVIDVYDSSLGVEFTAGTLAGLLDGDGEGSLISHLWAGNTCIAR